MANDAHIFGEALAGRGGVERSRVGAALERLAPRVFSLIMLGAVSAGLTCAVETALMAARDAFVAPAILSPESDIVIAGKIKLSELSVERARAGAELESTEADIAADDLAIVRLSDLKGALDSAKQFASDFTAGKAAAGAAELEALAEQRSVIARMREEQADLARRAEADERSGLISRTDFDKETQKLNQLRLAMLDNDRAILHGQAGMRETALEQRALARSDAPLTPELAAHAEQAIRVELEALRVESDRRSKWAQKTAIAGRIAKIEELEAQLKGRPLYRAVEGRLDVAFVPYSQLEGVAPESGVYSCLWGLLFCKQVGTVTELVEGELTLQDPWGSLTRGQYAVLDLWDHEAAKSKVLRVRAPAAATPSSTAPGVPIARK